MLLILLKPSPSQKPFGNITGRKEEDCKHHFLLFLQVFCSTKNLPDHSVDIYLTHYQMTNFRLFQTKKFADDSFKFDKNGRKLSKWVENIVFSKGVKRCHGVGIG